MPAQWLNSSSDVRGRVTAAVEGGLRGLAQPARAHRLRQVLLALFALWAVLALAGLVWGLFPAAQTPATAQIKVLNPVSMQTSATTAVPVDIQRMVGWHLFGKAGAPAEHKPKVSEATAAATNREGIEQGASETRLDLKLRGVVASTEDGLGHAIIENKKRQAIYAVDDKLPVSGRVVLAKVMPRQVVLDNGGKYELLTLYEDSGLDAQLPARTTKPKRPNTRAKQGGTPSAGTGSTEGTTTLARDYRERLYQDPQSLAEVVSVSAVRQDGELLGYRIGPGKDQQQFKQLGFKSGDLVTSINGIALNDPANTMRLYQTMRSAGEAIFDLQRGGQEVTVSVSLGSVEGE